MEKEKEKESTKQLISLLDNHIQTRSLEHQRQCLFCRKEFNASWDVLFDHMLQEHGFHVGRPDNMVNIDEFLDLLQRQLESFICIYCTRTFPDYEVLKRHMRKKKHFRIPSSDPTFDRFYIINHLQDTSWRDVDEDSDDSDIDLEQNQLDDWGEWVVDGQSANDIERTVCLLCEVPCPSAGECLTHMTQAHEFDLKKYVAQNNLDELGVARFINFMRLQPESGKRVPESIDTFSSFEYLKPVLSIDPLLVFDMFDSTSEPEVTSNQSPNQ